MTQEIIVPPGSQLAEFLALCERFGRPVRMHRWARYIVVTTDIHERGDVFNSGNAEWWFRPQDGSFAA